MVRLRRVGRRVGFCRPKVLALRRRRRKVDAAVVDFTQFVLGRLLDINVSWRSHCRAAVFLISICATSRLVVATEWVSDDRHI